MVVGNYTAPIAIILAIGPTLAAVASFWQARTAAKQSKDAAHTSSQAMTTLNGNGQGTVPVMLERLIEWTTAHDERHVFVEKMIHPMHECPLLKDHE